MKLFRALSLSIRSGTRRIALRSWLRASVVGCLFAAISYTSAHASRTFNGSTTSLSATTVPHSTAPMTVSAWFRSTSNTAAQSIVVSGYSGADNRSIQLLARGDLANDPVSWTWTDSSTQGSAPIEGYTANTWHHATGMQVSSTSRFVYLDGVASAENTTSVGDPASLDRFDIGRRILAGTAGLYFSGEIAEAAIWNVALSAAEITSLAKGLSPQKVRPQALVFYAPLVRNVQDTRAGLALTDNGPTTVADHPRIYR